MKNDEFFEGLGGQEGFDFGEGLIGELAGDLGLEHFAEGGFEPGFEIAGLGEGEESDGELVELGGGEEGDRLGDALGRRAKFLGYEEMEEVSFGVESAKLFPFLSALLKSCPTDCGTPAFLAKAGLFATAAMKLCCFLDSLGIGNSPTRPAAHGVCFPDANGRPANSKEGCN